jgi:hypothetical protein
MSFKWQQIVALIIIIALIVAYTCYSIFDLEVWWVNFSEKERLPIVYKNYKPLDRIHNFGKHTIQLAFEIKGINNGATLDQNVEHYLNNNNELIIQTAKRLSSDSFLFHFYKLDKAAKVIDSVSFLRSYLIKDSTGEEALFNGYLINKELKYYKTWPMDGNRSKVFFTPINKNLTWSDERINHYYDSIKQNYLYLDELDEWEAVNSEENKMRIRKIFLLDKTWYILYGNNLKSGDINHVMSIGSENNLFKAYHAEDMASLPIEHANFSLDYVHEENYVKEEGINYGSYNYYWEGVLYFHLVVGNDTLKFKSNQKWLEDEPVDKFKLDYGFYQNNQLNYSLFTNDGKKLYIIK